MPYIQVDRKQKERDFLSRQGFEDQEQEVALQPVLRSVLENTDILQGWFTECVRGYTLKTCTYGRETQRYTTLMY